MQSIETASPESIMKIGFGFMNCKILVAAIKFGLFTLLAEKPSLSLLEIKASLKFQCSDRHLFDFLDSLMVLGLLKREGLLQSAKYSNSLNSETFLDKNKPSYVGGVFETLVVRLYHSWEKFDEILLTGKSYFSVTGVPKTPFDEVYKTPEEVQGFMDSMNSLQKSSYSAFVKKCDLSKYKTIVDVGGANGLLAAMIAKENPHISAIDFDLPAVELSAKKMIDSFQVADRVRFIPGDFFRESFPKADLVLMSQVLLDWDEEKKLILIQKAFEAVPEGGALVVLEKIIDEERKQNLLSLTLSLNMLVEIETGFCFTHEDFKKWAKQTGFKSTEIVHLEGPASAIFAFK